MPRPTTARLVLQQDVEASAGVSPGEVLQCRKRSRSPSVSCDDSAVSRQKTNEETDETSTVAAVPPENDFCPSDDQSIGFSGEETNESSTDVQLLKDYEAYYWSWLSIWAQGNCENTNAYNQYIRELHAYYSCFMETPEVASGVEQVEGELASAVSSPSRCQAEYPDSTNTCHARIQPCSTLPPAEGVNTQEQVLGCEPRPVGFGIPFGQNEIEPSEPDDTAQTNPEDEGTFWRLPSMRPLPSLVDLDVLKSKPIDEPPVWRHVEKLLLMPAREQMEPADFKKVAYLEGQNEYNIWYGRFATDRSDPISFKQDPAWSTLDVWKDTGFTQATAALDRVPDRHATINSTGGTVGRICPTSGQNGCRSGYESSYICLFYTRGCCTKGASCAYHHRPPLPQDEYGLEITRDIFGRERYNSHRDDMDGVSQYLR
eukprot:GHVT01077839.1.p1 GENE.GHVT01077839.1~~GHVT01077839.1.p1  ORF type:complete len:429 (-),score=20.44 GHVT01077839.1:1276-2562(-)